MYRARVVLLSLVAAGLLVRGVPPAGAHDPASAPDVAAGPQPTALADALTPTAIGGIVGSANPNLSESERGRIGRAVVRCSEGYGLDPQLVTAIILVESGARPWARSPKGAVGLMQVMPHMARDLPLGGNLTTIESNVEAGCWILSDNIRRLGEDDGISAYFWGSRIRGVAYLHRVRAARATVRRLTRS